MCLHVMEVATNWFMDTQKICQRCDRVISMVTSVDIFPCREGRAISQTLPLLPSLCIGSILEETMLWSSIFWVLSVTRGRHREKTNHLVACSSGQSASPPFMLSTVTIRAQASFTVHRHSLMIFFILDACSCPQAPTQPSYLYKQMLFCTLRKPCLSLADFSPSTLSYGYSRLGYSWNLWSIDSFLWQDI